MQRYENPMATQGWSDLEEQVAWKIVTAIHADFPEEKRPKGWADMSVYQTEKMRKAANDAINATASYEVPEELPGHMVRASTMMLMLRYVLDRFGNTCVYIRKGGLSWGAVAMNRQSDDEKRGIFDILAQHDVDREQHAGQVKRLMSDRDRWMMRALDAEKLCKELREAAERWRALMNCERIRVMGWAGFNVDPHGKYTQGREHMHMGIELWNKHEAKHPSEEFPQEKCRSMLTWFVDQVRKAMPSTTEDKPEPDTVDTFAR